MGVTVGHEVADREVGFCQNCHKFVGGWIVWVGKIKLVDEFKIFVVVGVIVVEKPQFVSDEKTETFVFDSQVGLKLLQNVEVVESDALAFGFDDDGVVGKHDVATFGFVTDLDWEFQCDV